MWHFHCGTLVILKICVSLLAFVWAASWTTSLAKARLTLHCTEWNTTDWALLYRFGVNAINDKDWFEKKFLFRASFARLRWWAELPAPLVSYCLIDFCVVVLLSCCVVVLLCCFVIVLLYVSKTVWATGVEQLSPLVSYAVAWLPWLPSTGCLALVA